MCICVHVSVMHLEPDLELSSTELVNYSPCDLSHLFLIYVELYLILKSKPS